MDSIDFDKRPDWRKVEVETEQFKKSAQLLSPNMAVVMYMVEALNYFKGMPMEAIKKIAFEIAMQGGIIGYNPLKSGYKLTTIKDKEFSGFHILAYYYVSWSLVLPGMVDQLEIPYKHEYELAKQFISHNAPP